MPKIYLMSLLGDELYRNEIDDSINLEMIASEVQNYKMDKSSYIAKSPDLRVLMLLITNIRIGYINIATHSSIKCYQTCLIVNGCIDVKDLKTIPYTKLSDVLTELDNWLCSCILSYIKIKYLDKASDLLMDDNSTMLLINMDELWKVKLKRTLIL